MQQPLLPLFPDPFSGPAMPGQQDQNSRPVPGGTGRLQIEGGTGSLWLKTANGFTFSYQEWKTVEPIRIPFSSTADTGILHLCLLGGISIDSPVTVNQVILTETTCSLGVHPVGQVYRVHFPTGLNRYLQIALSSALLEYLLPTIQPPPKPTTSISAPPEFSPLLPVPKQITRTFQLLGPELMKERSDLLLLNQWGSRLLTWFQQAIQRFYQQQSWKARKLIRLEELEAYINDHLDTEDRPLLSVSALSALLKVSRYRFLQLFQERYGQTPATYIRDRRLETALRYLQNGQAPGTIYTRVGYEDFAAFTKSFTRHYGKPPSHFHQKR